ncbi:MAG TPA: zinc-ribbon domain-containing protein [Alphaproteobacteria bacterium]|nr:zinc-ribbon domain-containing protein [Alphaproteobacteria bacterium]
MAHPLIKGRVLREFAAQRGDMAYMGPDLTRLSYPERWFCKVCGHEWKATPYDVTKLGRGCPECAQALNEGKGHPASRLEPLGVRVVGEWRGARNRNTFGCLRNPAHENWEEFGLVQTNDRRGCPACKPRRQWVRQIRQPKMPMNELFRGLPRRAGR